MNNKYHFEELKEDGDWQFYPMLLGPEAKRLERAAREYARRHRFGVTVMGGHRKGETGVWVNRRDIYGPVEMHKAQPSEGELNPNWNSRWPLGKIHYDGGGWIPLATDHNDQRLPADLASLRLAVRHYEERHNIKLAYEPEIRNGVFGWAFEVQPEVLGGF